MHRTKLISFFAFDMFELCSGVGFIDFSLQIEVHYEVIRNYRLSPYKLKIQIQ